MTSQNPKIHHTWNPNITIVCLIFPPKSKGNDRALCGGIISFVSRFLFSLDFCQESFNEKTNFRSKF